MLITVVGLWCNGGGMDTGKRIKEAYGDADASIVLTWAAFISSLAIMISGIARRKLSIGEAIDAWVAGAKTMLVAVIILPLAFALKAVITDMGLAKWLVESTQGALSGRVLPSLTFVIALILAFSTGTSWGANSILMPIVIPVSAAVSGATDAPTSLMIATMGAVLTGAVFGDHCSPISDTTILSSMASGSDHIDHVRTQIPYAITAGAFALLVGFIPVGFGLPVWILLAIGFACLYFTVKLVEEQLDEQGEIIVKNVFIFGIIHGRRNVQEILRQRLFIK